MDDIKKLKAELKHAIKYLNDPKIDRERLSMPHRIALESRIDTMADVVMLINGQQVDLTNCFWNIK